MSGALVGPLPTITFADGSRQPYNTPRDTLDLRYRLCTRHHPACDCREAMLAETASEYRAMYQDAVQAAVEVLAGHPTWAWETDLLTGETRDVSCRCTGCQIARAAHLISVVEAGPFARARLVGSEAA